ncbi:hypothetical protein ACSZMK_13835 [Aeromonas caviae]
MNLYRTLILLCLLCLQPVQALTLHSRYDPAPLPPRWSEAELGWLRQQSQLRVGILQEDYRPFTMIARQRVEGLSADYIDLLARMLDKPVALSAFPDKAHLLRALARGEIHLASLGNLTLADSDTRAIRLSNPYFSSPLVFSVPRRYRGALLTPGQRVAAVRDQIDRARFVRYYPTLTLVTYPSNMERSMRSSSAATTSCWGMPTPPTTSTASASTTFASGARPRPSWRLPSSALPSRPPSPPCSAWSTGGWRPSTTGRATPSSPSGTGPSAT